MACPTTVYNYFMDAYSSTHKYNSTRKSLRIYWCVAYLPSEASIIEH
jgi:hypothetical protein